MNYRAELNRHEETLIRMTKTLQHLDRSISEAKQAILELDAAFRRAGLLTDGGVGSLPSPSEDSSPVLPSADDSSTIQA